MFIKKLFNLLVGLYLSIFKNEQYSFRIGTSTSAYQIESYENRSTTIWDVFTNIINNDTVSNGPNHEKHYERDFDIIEEIGLKDYRLSFAWSRFFHDIDSPSPNPEGILFYKKILKQLKLRKIEPCVTLFHWDMPLFLQENKDIKGFETMNITKYFLHYADTVFTHFHKEVKCWITINEPFTYVYNGYVTGTFAPGEKNETLSEIVFHNMMKTHILTYNLFHYKQLDGIVSISLNSDWISTTNNTRRNEELMYRFGKYVDYIIPRNKNVTYIDFFALNHYTTIFLDDKSSNLKFPITSSSSWLYYYPPGFGKLLRWIDETYHLNDRNISMRITENGWSSDKLIDDDDRIMYLKNYMLQAQHSKVNITHYYVWSLIDNFEWASGFSERFGIVYINFTSHLKERSLKKSALWLKSLQTV